MRPKTDAVPSNGKKIFRLIKDWIMVALLLIFVLLYASALVGWLRPVADITFLTRLEPIIFVVMGYYFGRLPSQQNEKHQTTRSSGKQ